MKEWELWFDSAPGLPPIGYVLREALPNRWLRIHNLPEGRRLPSGSADRTELLLRNNIIASLVLGIGSQCTIFQRLPDHAGDGGDGHDFWALSNDRKEDLSNLRLAVENAKWVPGAFNQQLYDIARGATHGTTYFSHTTKGIYCPYDGGADVFVADEDNVGFLSNLLLPWRSTLHSGL